ncbi:MAG: MBL fold metallo-hydrolase [Chitinophaga sp.]|uniref:MBL fold metallo-hydrolase n=1 Tax=Chitinophaga sp. TaxID=1869181 RepID=UPI0025C2729E|nr:MBL fold metallo-hydrolase [Chitinophaga sp.]MBV8252398.1 MBL fold metallo-hydrolase [Chitinophaga sp.]
MTSQHHHAVMQGFTAFQSANMEILVVTDGDVPYNSDCFAPGIDRPELNSVRVQSSDYITLAHNILVISAPPHLVLIDAGNGYSSAPAAGCLPDNLKATGIDPADVTDIILTHAHPDHINGLIDEAGLFVFPNAEIHLQEAEYNFWQSVSPDFSKSKNLPKVLKQLHQDIRQVLAAIGPKLRLFNTSDPMFPFLRPILAPGHTPGHCMFAVTAGSETFIHMADICHDAEILFSRPEWGTIFDVDFDLAAQTRRRILGELADSQQLVFAYHLQWPGFGRIVRIGNEFKWVPGR